MNDENNKIILPHSVKIDSEAKSASTSIIDYFRKETSILIAALSVASVLFASYFKLCSYLNQVSYLKYWDISSTIVENTSSYWLNYIGFSFFFFIGSAYSFLYIVSNYPVYLECSELLRAVKKEINKTKKKCKKAKKELNKTLRMLNNMEKSDLIIRTNEKITSEKQEIESYEKDTVKFKTEINICKRYLRTQALIVIILIGMVLIPSVSLLIIYDRGNVFNSIILAIILYILVFIALYVLHLIILFVRILLKKTLKLSSYSKEDRHRILTAKKSATRIFRMNPDRKITNSDLFGVAILLFIYVVMFMLFSSQVGNSKAKDQKTFNVVKYCEEEYAIIQSDSGYIIAEKIDINEKEATIITGEQIVLKKENIISKKYSFDSVSVKRNSG